MTKLYTDLTTEELRLEIKRLSENQTPDNADHATRVEGQTPLERYLKELHKRGEGLTPENQEVQAPG